MDINTNYSIVANKVERFARQGCRVIVLGYTPHKVRNDELPKGISEKMLLIQFVSLNKTALILKLFQVIILKQLLRLLKE